MKKLSRSILSLLNAHETEKLTELLHSHDFHEIATAINELPVHEDTVFRLLPAETQAKVMFGLNAYSKQKIFPRLTGRQIAHFLRFTDDDDAADLIQFLPKERRVPILNKLRETKRSKIEKLLKFHPETAGGLMDANFILIKDDFTIADVAEKVQRHVTVEEQPAPVVVVADEKGMAIGYLPYKQLITAKDTTTISEILEKLPLISYTTNQRKTLETMLTTRETIAGVVDENRQLLGIVHVKNLATIVNRESARAYFGLFGVRRDEEAVDSVHVSVTKRYQWLLINMATAFLAAFVVAQFEETIAEAAILAAYLPVVAGMGGNAGMQSLAVTIRGIALGDISFANARPLIAKEVSVGVINGVFMGLVAGTISFMVADSAMLGVVLMLAVIVNLIAAGLSGALIPLLLKGAGIDPAVASSVFLTTVTDIVGFFVFLGLAEMILL